MADQYVIKPEEKEPSFKVSYMSKEDVVCPVCTCSFKREELLTGSGRLIAASLTDELHRLYQPSSRYGDVYPLVYQATVCPQCWFASTEADFPNIPKEKREAALADEGKRKADVETILGGVGGEVSFSDPRGLVNGAASQFLVLSCYDYYTPDFSPTIKQGIASLRASWLFDDLDKKFPGQHYDWLAVLFKRKARFFYGQAVNTETKGTESLSGINNFGPDTDKNYGYEGALYLTGLLEYKYGSHKDPALRMNALAESKRTIAKIFGIGKTSKSKPGPLLEKGKHLYELIGTELKEFDE
jgi:uncharacterized protein (DUF2225 family)